MEIDLLKDTAKFFGDFVEAFSTFDGAVIAERYFSSYIALHTDGNLECFNSSAEIAEYFQRYLDEYHRNGCRSCGYKEIETVPIGKSCVLATVTWELYSSTGAIISTWRESYNLSYAGERLMVFASIDHAA